MATLIPTLGHQVKYQQTEMPNYAATSFLADDADTHDYIVDARGKGRLTVAVRNDSNQTVTVTVYGAHTVDADPGDAGADAAFTIGSFTVLATALGYETINDPFPWYVIRLQHADVPDPATTTTRLWANIGAY